MKRLIAPLEMIIKYSIKAFLFMIAATTAAYADTNSFDASSDIAMKYITGDTVSAEGGLQAEVLVNTEDNIEIGLFNQENQMTAMLMWDVKKESGKVILNLNTQDEKTLPVQITEQMNPNSRMQTLTSGLHIMAAATRPEPLASEEPEFRSTTTTTTTHSRVTNAASLPVIVTWGRIDPHQIPNGFEERLRDHVTKSLTGRLISYTRVSGGSDRRPVWVRFMAHNHSQRRWEVMGWLKVEPHTLDVSRFSYTIPEPYDLDRNGNDLGKAKLSREYDPHDWRDPNTYPAYVMRYAADAWSGPGKQQRTTFITTERAVLDKP
ncbi:MAG: hypothetical protein V3V22_05355 [Methylococcales bacterium]